MRLLAIAACVFLFGGYSRAQQPEPDSVEQQQLSSALAEAGASPIDFMRALENHLAKYPKSPHKAEIERAIVKSAIEAKDDRRIVLYGERVLEMDSNDLQILDRVARALLAGDDKPNAEKALAYAKRYEKLVNDMRKQPVPGRYGEGQWQTELDQGSARALILEARATGNLGKLDEAAALASRACGAYPSADAAREISRWLAKEGKNMEAVEHLADAFTIEDPHSTEVDRGRDRMRMGELYQKANGSEKGLGDLILKAYDRTSALASERSARLKAKDPNAQATKILDFTLPAVTGNPLPLDSLLGKTIVFDFWATWCGPCRAQHPLYEKVKERFRGNPNVVFLSIDTDEDRALVAPFLKAANWNQQVYFEAGMSRTLQISSIPTTIIVDRSGRISSRMNGYLPDRFVDLLSERIEQTLKD
ncbi:MAG: thioredoxin-like domain-containing protein [Bryobacteraceae bacterium]